LVNSFFLPSVKVKGLAFFKFKRVAFGMDIKDAIFVTALRCKTIGCGAEKQVNGWIWCDACESAKTVTTTEWIARLCAKKKNRSIRLVFTHNSNHMMIVWPPKKADISAEHFEYMYEELCRYLDLHDNTLSLRLVKTCTNCTYFRGEDEFETLIFGFRKRFKLNDKKDLPLEDDPRHAHLKELEVWDADHPIWLHAHSRRDTPLDASPPTMEDNVWFEALWSKRNSTLIVKIDERIKK
jgi:hypothetical protein